jgi:hypothetical protein
MGVFSAIEPNLITSTTLMEVIYAIRDDNCDAFLGGAL